MSGLIDLGLNGQSLTAVTLGYEIILLLSGDARVATQVRVGNDFELTSASGAWEMCELSNIEDLKRAAQNLLDVFGRQLSNSSIDDSGCLQLEFDGGRKLRVSPSDSVEAFDVQLSGRTSRRILSTPGGRLDVSD